MDGDPGHVFSRQLDLPGMEPSHPSRAASVNTAVRRASISAREIGAGSSSPPMLTAEANPGLGSSNGDLGGSSRYWEFR
jgi:hypothetical protein